MSTTTRRWWFPALLFLSASFIACARGRGGGGGVELTNPSLTSPAGGEIFSDIVEITWSGVAERPDVVMIELSSDSGENFDTVIEEETEDDGVYWWDSNTVPDGDGCRLQLTFTDSLGYVRKPVAMDTDFTIDNTAPEVVLVGPSGAAVLRETVDVTWTTEEVHAGTVDIRISSDSGGSFPTLLAGGLADGGGYSWDTTALPDGELYRIRITGTDALGNHGEPADSVADLAIDNTPPVIELTSPVGGEEISDQHTITWTTTDAHPGTVEIRLSSDSGGSFPVLIEAAAPDTGSHVWDTSEMTEGTTYRVRVLPTDETGWEGAPSASADDFIIAHIPYVGGPAFFRDENGNGSADAGDVLVVPFDRAVAVNGAVESDFELPVAGDTFGPGAVIAAGADPTEVVVTFAAAPTLKGRGRYDENDVGANGSSGIDVSATMAPDAIEGLLSGADAQPSGIVDVAPGFVPGTSIGTVAHGTRAVLLCDLDRDGNPDLVVANDDAAAQVLFGDGAGGFTDSGQAIGGGNTAAIVALDAEGDGDEDLFLGNAGTADSIWRNDGSGVFTDWGQSLGSADTTALAAGDVDRDGDLDVVAGSDGGAHVLWRNNGIGTFADAGVALGSGDARSVSLGDLDGDGDLDLVIGHSTTANAVFWGDGAGGFADSGQTIEAGRCALGDVDRDGDLDLVKVCPPDELGVWTNPGTGAFTDSGARFGEAVVSALALVDVDGNGFLDVVAGVPGGRDEIWMNDGSGAFDARIRLESDEPTAALALADLDGDGGPDLVAGHDQVLPRAHRSSLSATWGTTTWVDTGQALVGGDTRGLAAGDVDGDGDIDLAIALLSGTDGNRVFRNDGAGGFTDSGQALGSVDSPCVALGDVDGDGDLDLVYGRQGGAGNAVFLNDGTGTFTDSGQSLGAEDTWRVRLADVDRDGDLDLFCANIGSEPDTVWWNDGAGGFTDSGQAIGDRSTRAAKFGDVDRDGDLDLVVGVDGDSDRVYVNDGTGTFTIGQALSATTTYGLDLGDLDGDGDLDVLAATQGGANEVWWNDGAGGFTDSGQSLGSGATDDLALGDLDADGDLDAIEVNWNEANRIWTNDGAGGFTDSGVTFPALQSRVGLLVDLDGDSDLDIVFGMFADDLLFASR